MKSQRIKAYKENLEKKLEKAGFSLNLGWDEKPSLMSVKDEIYPILADLVKSYKVVFSAELAHILQYYFKEYEGEISRDVALVGPLYGIKSTRLQNILESFYGNCDVLYANPEKWGRIKQNMYILYISEESLKKFIKQNTKREMKVIINFI